MAIKYGPAQVTAITKITDGDTFRCNIARWSPIVGRDMPVRIRGYNAPELRTKDPIEKAKAIRAQSDLKLLLDTASRIELYNIERGKYFRLICTVLIDGVDIAIPMRECISRRLRVNCIDKVNQPDI